MTGRRVIARRFKIGRRIFQIDPKVDKLTGRKPIRISKCHQAFRTSHAAHDLRMPAQYKGHLVGRKYRWESKDHLRQASTELSFRRCDGRHRSVQLPYNLIFAPAGRCQSASVFPNLTGLYRAPVFVGQGRSQKRQPSHSPRPRKFQRRQKLPRLLRITLHRRSR